MVVSLTDLTIPTVPEIVPRPMDPVGGVAMVEYIEVNFWLY